MQLIGLVQWRIVDLWEVNLCLTYAFDSLFLGCSIWSLLSINKVCKWRHNIALGWMFYPSIIHIFEQWLQTYRFSIWRNRRKLKMASTSILLPSGTCNSKLKYATFFRGIFISSSFQYLGEYVFNSFCIIMMVWTSIYLIGCSSAV